MADVTGVALKALLISDLVDSTRLVSELGDVRAAEIFERHDRVARDLLRKYEGREIDKTDGFLLLFERPFDAVLYAMDYHQTLATLSAEVEVELASRVGIHVGEVVLRENPEGDVALGAKPLEVEGLAKPTAARLMALAKGRQTLLSRSAYDVAKRSAVGVAAPVGAGARLGWVAHGAYQVKGIEEPLEIFEVGIEGFSPLAPPDDVEKAQRVGGGVALWNVPVPRNPFFTGREGALAELADVFGCAECSSPGPSSTRVGPRFALLSGLGGVGKTQTAVEYAYRHRQRYAAVLFTRAETEDELFAGLLEIAELLDLPEHRAQDPREATDAVRRWLATHDDWLLILDNADTPELVVPYLPRTGRGGILLTSRAQVIDARLEVRRINLSALPTSEGVELLLRRCGRGEGHDPKQSNGRGEEAAAAQELVHELGGLPLALEQAGAFLHEHQARVGDYLRSYRARRLAVLGEGEGAVSGEREPVATTWELNFQAVEKSSPAAAELLRASAFLAPDAIPRELLVRGGRELGESLAQALEGAVEDPLCVDRLLQPLSRYSLVQRDTEARAFNVHRLVQEVAIAALEPEDRCAWSERIVAALAASFPGARFRDWPLCERLLPHVRVAAKWIDVHRLDDELSGFLLGRAGLYAAKRARFAEAESFYCRALEIGEKTLGKDNPGLTPTLQNLAWLYRDQGRYADAEPLLVRALEVREKALGRRHFRVAQSLNNLAELYRSQRRFAEAEPLYRESLEIRRETEGEEHPHVAKSLNNLALLYHAQERYEEAEPLLLRSLEIREKSLGEEHYDVARSLNNLGLLYQAQGRYAEAEPRFRRALELREKALGAEHPQVAQSLNNLASLYRDQGRFDAAEELLRRSLEMRERSLGSEHPQVAQSLNNLALLYQAARRWEEAEELFQKSLVLRERTYGGEHPIVAQSLENYAALLREQRSKILFWKTPRQEEIEAFESRARAIRSRHA